MVISFVGTSMHENTENELRFQEEYIYLLVEQMPVAVAMFDSRMHYIVASQRWLADYRLSKQEIIGRSYFEVFTQASQQWQLLCQRCLAGETINSEADIFQHNNGHIDWIKWKACPWYTAQNTIGGVILFTDIVTKQKQAVETLKQSNELLEEKIKHCTLEQLQASIDEKDIKDVKEITSHLVANSIHEFRTPLTTLLSSLFLLEQYIAPEAESKEAIHISKIRSSVQHLGSMINTFISLNHFNNEVYKMHYEIFDLKELGQDIIYLITGLLKKGQKLVFSYSGAIEIYQDKKTLIEILYKLLAGTVKSSEENQTINLFIDVSGSEMKMHIGNNICLPVDERDRILEYTLEDTNLAGISQMVDSLNIIKQCIELMKGNIIIRNKPGKGICFVIKIPVQKAS